MTHDLLLGHLYILYIRWNYSYLAHLIKHLLLWNYNFMVLSYLPTDHSLWMIIKHNISLEDLLCLCLERGTLYNKNIASNLNLAESDKLSVFFFWHLSTRLKLEGATWKPIPYGWAFACSTACFCGLLPLVALLTIPFNEDVSENGEYIVVKSLPHWGQSFVESLKQESIAV
jgi:hypothetical protein